MPSRHVTYVSSIIFIPFLKTTTIPHLTQSFHVHSFYIISNTKWGYGINTRMISQHQRQRKALQPKCGIPKQYLCVTGLFKMRNSFKLLLIAIPWVHPKLGWIFQHINCVKQWNFDLLMQVCEKVNPTITYVLLDGYSFLSVSDHKTFSYWNISITANKFDSFHIFI